MNIMMKMKMRQKGNAEEENDQNFAFNETDGEEDVYLADGQQEKNDNGNEEENDNIVDIVDDEDEFMLYHL
jgi:hypothetical protein